MSILLANMVRREFLVTMSFAMTNKNQGFPLRNAGIHFIRPVFTFEQLYLVLSQVRTLDGLIIHVWEKC